MFWVRPAVFILVYIWLCECLICLILLNDNTRLWLLSICFLAFIIIIIFCSKSFNIVALVMVELLCFLCGAPKCSLSLQTSASLKTQEIGLGLWGPTTSKKKTNNKERFKILICQKKYKWWIMLWGMKKSSPRNRNDKKGVVGTGRIL